MLKATFMTGFVQTNLMCSSTILGMVRQGWLTGKDICSLAEKFVRTHAEIRKKTCFDPEFGVNPVHRLDKETSGVMLLAVNREMFHYFSEEFENRAVIKQYLALLHGNLDNPGADSSGGTWNWPCVLIFIHPHAE